MKSGNIPNKEAACQKSRINRSKSSDGDLYGLERVLYCKSGRKQHDGSSSTLSGGSVEVKELARTYSPQQSSSMANANDLGYDQTQCGGNSHRD